SDRAQIDLQCGSDFDLLGFGKLGDEISDEILLSALAENHAIDRKGFAQLVQTINLSAERHSRNVPLNLCLASEYPKHILLGLLYILRSAMFAAYFMLPPTPTSTLLFAAAMGILWWPGLAPLVAGLVAEIFGTRYMATLLGVSFVVHQLGSSVGAWGGGFIFDLSGSYDAAWQIGTLIGFAAGVVQILAGGPTRRDDRMIVPAAAPT